MNITSNHKIIEIYLTIVRSNDLHIANLNNNWLTNIYINNPEQRKELLKFFRCFAKHYFLFEDLSGIDMIFFIIIWNDADKYSQKRCFSIIDICIKNNIEIKHERLLSFMNCYILNSNHII